MNKAQLIDAIAKDAKMPKTEAKKALEGFVTSTTKALGKGDRVALVGFGSFSVAKRAARKGRNPQTGKEIKIAAKKVVKFKAGAELTKKVK
jgi:DNA-binding protein HU-beta